MKAYDYLDWEYVLHCLKCFGVPGKFISWISACITSPSFTIALNGTLVGFFQGKKGLRQGDPISPYLFVIAMEGLTLLMEEAAASPHFGYHPKCAAVKLTHLCFAVVLLVFSAASASSVTTIIGALAEFEHILGLKANPSKSSIFLAGVAEDVKQNILNTLHMSEGTLPVKYLGVPLITKRLTSIDCEALVNKITTRVDSWLVKKLTFAGPLQLISSVLLSMQVFWANFFILPKKVIRLIEQKLNWFLWSGRDTKAHVKVAWSKLGVPKKEGGLGIKRIEIWNKASMLNHIWNLFTKVGSLWVAWINANRLKGRCLWEISIPNSCSWSWKKTPKAS